MNDSVKNNIVFHGAWHEERYKRVLDACALGQDMGVFRDGDRTEVRGGCSHWRTVRLRKKTNYDLKPHPYPY